MDAKDNLILALRRNFLIPDRLFIGKLPETGSENSMQWAELTPNVDVPEIDGSTYKYFDLVASGDSVSKYCLPY